MRFGFGLLVFALLLGLAGPVQAQNEIIFSDVEVKLWPEYDRADMLVIYQMTLDSSVELPAVINIRIPAAADEPHAVAIQDMSGQLMERSYEVTEDGDWLVIALETSMPGVWIEYYDPRLSREEDRRTFRYEWAGDYEVEAMQVTVQQPPTAEPLQIQPNMASTFTDQSGLTHYLVDVGSVPRGRSFSLALNYEKPNDDLTFTGNEPVQSDLPAANAQGQFELLDALPYLGVFIVLTLGAGAWLLMKDRQHSQQRASRPRHRTRAEPQREANGQAIFCSHCGKKAAAGDAFCRACGSRLRSG